MKLLFRFLVLLLPVLSFAQLKRANSFYLSPDSLARHLTAPYTNDKDKVAAIFNWITDNIAYNVKSRRNAAYYSSHVMDDPEDTGALKPLSERVAIQVLNQRIAFCDGYSRLFKTLCDYAGIRSEVVTGYSGINARSRQRFSSNHRWNAVYLDSAWQLLDATWAAGYVSFSDEFIRMYNDYYFLTPPKDFARDHYPEDLQWTLLPQPPVLSEFRNAPFRTNAYVKKKIISYKPLSGTIQASVGDTLHLELLTTDENKNVLIIDTPFVDSAIIVAAKADTTKGKLTIAGDKVLYDYIVTSPNTEWLNIVFDDEIVMRYKLNIRKNDTAAIK